VSAAPTHANRVPEVQCPLCGERFPRRDSCVVGCPFAGSCKTLCCPHCHYRFVEESTLTRWLDKLLHGERA
jgi:C4-type Zn-finger protein